MNITGPGASLLAQTAMLGRTQELSSRASAGVLDQPANPAGARTILPPANAGAALSLNTILTLQTQHVAEERAAAEAAAASAAPSNTEKFLEEAQKTPMERLREQILEELGLTEESLAQLPPEEKRAMEDKIREMIEEKLRQGMASGADAPNTNAAMLQSVA